MLCASFSLLLFSFFSFCLHFSFDGSSNQMCAFGIKLYTNRMSSTEENSALEERLKYVYRIIFYFSYLVTVSPENLNGIHLFIYSFFVGFFLFTSMENETMFQYPFTLSFSLLAAFSFIFSLIFALVKSFLLLEIMRKILLSYVYF